jgi:uridine kinase
MLRAALITKLVEIITRMRPPHPLRVAIDGVDASGKTTLAEELALGLVSSGRQIIHASVDGFHNPAHIRYQRGKLSPEGFYLDSYNYAALIEYLLKPLGPHGDLRYRNASFDLEHDLPLQMPLTTAQVDAILLMDGIFLLRPELRAFWDLTIYIDVDFTNTITRGAMRDAQFIDSFQDAMLRYQQRYVPGQQRYMQEVQPLDKADILIDNNNLEQPEFIKIPPEYLPVNDKNDDIQREN